MNKIYISGNKGFVGQNLEQFLNENGFEIIGVTRKPICENEISYKRISKDKINNSIAFIHLAGKAHDLKGVSDENEYFEVNTELTKTLYNQFLNSDCKTFIYMSSVKAVADKVTGVLSEEIEAKPSTAYGKSKLAAEQYLLAQQLPEGKKLYVLRPCMIHGPGNKGNLNLLYKLVSMRIPWLLGLFENKRSYCSIENLLFIINELIENKNISSGVYNVSDDIPLSTNEVISLISDSQNNKPLIWNVYKILIKIIARLGDLIPIPLNSERLNKLTESYIVSNAKIKKAIGKTLPVNSKDGILNTFQSFQSNNNFEI